MRKTNFLASAIIAALLMGAASCSGDDAENLAQPSSTEAVSDNKDNAQGLITFTAGDGDASLPLQKAVYKDAEESGAIIWQAGDVIKIYRASILKSKEVTLAASDVNGSSCQFSVPDELKDENGYYAFYPRCPSNYFPATRQLDAVDLPCDQKVAANQFDPKADVMVAYADDESRHFDFKHVVTKLGIKVPLDGVKSIRISCKQDIAGEMLIDVPTNPASAPSAIINSTNSKTITLTCTDNVGFQKGCTYYACLAPLPEDTKVRIDFCTDNDGKTGISFKASFSGGLKRAFRNFMDCTDSKAKKHEFPVSLASISDLGISKSASKIVFDYLDNYNVSALGNPTHPGDNAELYMYEVSSSVGTEYYYLSDYEITMPESVDEMFEGCAASTIELVNFNTENVTSMKKMFSGSQNLKVVDMSGFNSSIIEFENMEGIFFGCPDLRTIYVNSNFSEHLWEKSGVYISLFDDGSGYPKNLRGGEGSYYVDCYYYDETNLFHIDDLDNYNPGLLTRKDN